MKPLRTDLSVAEIPTSTQIMRELLNHEHLPLLFVITAAVRRFLKDFSKQELYPFFGIKVCFHGCKTPNSLAARISILVVSSHRQQIPDFV